MQKTEAQILAEALDQTRKLAHYYINKLKDVDVTKRFEMDGKKFNSVIWELAHMAWVENALILRTLDGKSVDLTLIKAFKPGSNPDQITAMPALQDVLQLMSKVHAVCLAFLSTIPDNVLDEPAYVAFTDWNTDKRHVIMHCIRHEGTHIGHLSWLCKMHGVKTI